MVTSPEAKAVVITQAYVCQIHSQRHINVRALEGGYLQEILIKEGQAVKKGDLMFKIVQTLYKAKLDAENAEANLAQIGAQVHRETVRDQGRLPEGGVRCSRPSWRGPRPRRTWRRPS